MRIVQLTPGTGGAYCGSCLRDHAAVKALRLLGHDALMVPLYLPHVTDDAQPEADAPVFFGGVNVYLQHKIGLFRHTPRWVDALFDARWLLRLAGRQAGMTKPAELGELTVSMLRGETGRQRKELDRLAAWLSEIGQADVVTLSNGLLGGLIRRLRERLRSAVVVTLQGEDFFLDGLPQPWRDQAWLLLAERLREADGLVAVSGYYARLMEARLGLAPGMVRVVHNGLDPSALPAVAGQPRVEPPPLRDRPVRVGYVAALAPNKGLVTLLHAMAQLRALPGAQGATLWACGSMGLAERPFLQTLQEESARLGLRLAVASEPVADAEITLTPNATAAQKLALLQGVRVLSVPTTYGEAFGLYVLEAWSQGVPVAQPRHAAFPELLGPTGAGLLCEPDDVSSLANALHRLLTDDALSAQASAAARAAVSEDGPFHVSQMARGLSDAFTTACAQRAAPMN